MKKGRVAMYVAITFIVLLATAHLGPNSFEYSFWTTFIVFFGVVLLLLYKFDGDRKKILRSFVLTLLALHGFASIFEGMPWAGLMGILGQFCACFFAYLFYINKNIAVRTAIIAFSVIICVYHFYRGNDYWLNYVTYGYANQKPNEKLDPSWSSYVNGNEYSNRLSDTNAIVLLDCFYTGCGICFQKFPLLQELQEKYKGNSEIFVCAVNIPWRRDTPGMAMNMVRKRGFTFPVIIAKEHFDSIFRIEFYPTVVVMKNNKMIFKGTIEDADKTIVAALNSLE